MPRAARRSSGTEVYHVMLRGVNRQQIFGDDEDNERFLSILKICKTASCFELYGYCLMGNHVHLLIKTNVEDIGQVIKRIGVRYVYWFNLKYRRVGHLFQDRFKSEPVENDSYILSVLRYIHQNPVKAGICSKPDDYKWSSYNEYFGSHGFVDRHIVLGMIGLDEFVKYHKAESADICMDDNAREFRLADAEAKAVMREICKEDTAEGFQKFNAQVRSAYIKEFKESGMSIRQISRITGIGKGIVEKL